jgi:hypothetical protein
VGGELDTLHFRLTAAHCHYWRPKVISTTPTPKLYYYRPHVVLRKSRGAHSRVLGKNPPVGACFKTRSAPHSLHIIQDSNIVKN